MYKDINFSISEHASKRISQNTQSLSEEIKKTVNELSSDGTFATFNSYINSRDAITNIYKNEQTKQRMTDLINQTFAIIMKSDMFSSNFQKRSKVLLEQINIQITSVYQDYINFLAEYKNSVQNIVKEINTYFQSTYTKGGQSMCDCMENEVKSLTMYCKSGGEYNEVRDGIILCRASNKL
jgi:sugar-specific transcriptional regulator TrmB